ncbi:MAG: CdaR family protein, partial [Anaerolineales bacterium]|nr:CdaR family protein [Anaerolineales bacterium]
TVLIQAGVSPIEGSLRLPGVPVDKIGLDNGLTALVSPTTVDVIISGPLSLLDTLSRQDVRATVDLTGLTAGTYQITPKVEIQIADVIVESILPNKIEVVITPIRLPAALPTPKP